MGDILDDWFGIELGGGSTPAPAPAPSSAANTQAAYNAEAARDQLFLNALDQYGPYGSLTYARRPDGTPYALSETLSPEVMAVINSQLESGKALTDAAQRQLGFLPQDKFQLPDAPTPREYSQQAFGSKILDPTQFADPLATPLYQSTRVDAGQTAPVDYTATQQSYNTPLQQQNYSSPFSAISAGQTAPVDYTATQQSYDSPFQQQSYDSQFQQQNYDSPFQRQSYDTPFQRQSYDSPFSAVSAGQTRDIGAETNIQPYSEQVNQQTYNAQGYDSPFAVQTLAPTPSTQDIANTFYEQATSRFQPDIDAARHAKEIELAQRGIPVGSSVYNDEMDRLDRAANNAYSDAARQAELAAGQEQSRQFGQNLQSAQFGSSENQRQLTDAQFAAQFGMTEEQFRAQFGSGEDARKIANQQFASQFGSSEDQRNYANALNAAGYYDQSDLARRQFASGENARNIADTQFGAQFGAAENARNIADTQFGAQFGAAENARNVADTQFGAQFGAAENARKIADAQFGAQFGAAENARNVADAQFGAQFGQSEDARLFDQALQQAGYYDQSDLARRQFASGENARNIADTQFGAQFGAAENARNVADTQFGAQFGQSEDARLFNQALQQAGYYDQSDLARRGLTASEDARMAGADLSNRQFLGTQQNQQYNQLLNALGYGQNEYQTNLSNQLLERNQPFSEAAALLGAVPGFGSPTQFNTPSANVAAPDYVSLVNTNTAANAQMSAAQTAANAKQNSSILGSIGQIGAAAAPFIFSDENLKTDRTPMDGEAVLMSFRDMPVDEYRYKEGAREAFNLPERRGGPMAQDWADAFGGDGRTIDIGDALGRIMGALKELDRRTMGRSA
jgi:hypothetical protein